MVIARVILKGARSYRVGDRRFIKDVPQIVKGDDVALFENNGYFHVAVMKSAAKATRDDTDDEEIQEVAIKKPGSKLGTSAKSKTAGLKKRT